MINIVQQIRPFLGGAECARMVALNHRNNQLYLDLSKSSIIWQIYSAHLFTLKICQMKNFLPLLFLFIPLMGMNQSICNSVLSTGGGYYSNGQTSLDWTIGEPIIDTYLNSISLTQGFHQTHTLPVFVAPLSIDDSVTFIIYPNPTNEYLFIKCNINPWIRYSTYQGFMTIISVTGKEISKYGFHNLDQIQKIDVRVLEPASYILIISIADQRKSYVFNKY